MWVKRLKTKLILVFFLPLITGCGIPNYFYLGSSYYPFSIRRQTEANSIVTSVNITFTDPIQLAKCEDCPSAVIFYWIDNERNVSNAGGSLASNFSSTFKKNEPSGGVPLTIYPDAQTSPVVDYTKTTSSSSSSSSGSTDSTTTLYTLYYATLVDGAGNNYPISSPTFHVPPTGSGGNTQINFEIVMDTRKTLTDDITENPDYKKIFLYQERGTGSESRFELRRYNMSPFNVIPEDKRDIESGNYNDYTVFSNVSTDNIQYNPTENVYVHFAVAFCASKGSFNNVFWSTLNTGAAGDNSATFFIGRDPSDSPPNASNVATNSVTALNNDKQNTDAN